MLDAGILIVFVVSLLTLRRTSRLLHDGGEVVVEDSVDGAEDDEGQQDQSSAPPPKKGRGRRLKSLRSQSEASQQTGAESSAPEEKAPEPSPGIVVTKPSPASSPAPSSISASEITRGLLEQRKAKLYPQTTSSAGASISTHVSVFNSSVDSMLRRNKRQERKGGDPDWIKTQDFIRKVCSVYFDI